MPKRISFAWTTRAILNRAKCATRRLWSDKYAQRFKKGDQVEAWNTQPHFKGAKKIALIELSCDPFRQALGEMTYADFVQEGERYLQDIGINNLSDFVKYFADRQGVGYEAGMEIMPWVIKFKIIETYD